MPVLRTLDRRFWLVSVAAAVGTLLVLGLPTAMIPNPVFGRQIEAEPFAYAVWIASAVLAGPLIATYLAPAGGRQDRHEADGVGRASLGGLVAFLAIGCPVCNKVAVVALGFSGALNVFGPIQPILGAASVVLLGATLAWRLRTRGQPCARCATSPGDTALTRAS
jgi:predicted membrane protein